MERRPFNSVAEFGLESAKIKSEKLIRKLRIMTILVLQLHSVAVSGSNIEAPESGSCVAPEEDSGLAELFRVC